MFDKHMLVIKIVFTILIICVFGGTSLALLLDQPRYLLVDILGVLGFFITLIWI